MKNSSFNEAAEELHRACADLGIVIVTQTGLAEIVQWLDLQLTRLARWIES